MKTFFDWDEELHTKTVQVIFLGSPGVRKVLYEDSAVVRNGNDLASLFGSLVMHHLAAFVREEGGCSVDINLPDEAVVRKNKKVIAEFVLRAF